MKLLSRRESARALLALGLSFTMACEGSTSPAASTVVTTASVAGTWTSVLAYSGLSYPFSLTLFQTQGVVSGMGLIRDEQGTHVMSVSNSTVVGSGVTLVMDYTSGMGASVRMTITGTVTKGTIITGVVNVVSPQPPPANIAIVLNKTG